MLILQLGAGGSGGVGSVLPPVSMPVGDGSVPGADVPPPDPPALPPPLPPVSPPDPSPVSPPEPSWA
ncbi:MAG: hypothetical protein HYT42_02220 [Candidatus Sungbacteria bacterium]|nr:hypothetical protein [Candidatus Sungbacteria bacterium]